MLGDVDQQICLLEGVNGCWSHGGDQPVGRGRHVGLVDEHSGGEVVFGNMDAKVSHGLDRDASLLAELHPNVAHVRELLQRLGRGRSHETHLLLDWSAHGIAHFRHKVVEGDIHLSVGDGEAAVLDQLLGRSIHLPELLCVV